MKKNLLTIGILLLSYTVQAQNAPLTHVDRTGILYVGKGALVYNGGGLQTKEDGKLENHGSVIIDGTSADKVATINSGGGDKAISDNGGNIVNMVNEQDQYTVWNPPATVNAAYTYGQLLIKGIPQANLVGIVTQNFRAATHGSYQQSGIPFFNKVASSLAEIKPFTTVRRSENEILVWNNDRVVFDMINPLTVNLGSGVLSANSIKPFKIVPTTYYSLGTKAPFNFGSSVRSMNGRPVSDVDVDNYRIKLSGAGAGINFGGGGRGTNEYNGYYNSYWGDFSNKSATNMWTGDYGKNIYQYANPFLTNLDFSDIKKDIPNLIAIRFEPSNVVYKANVGTTTGSYKFVTYQGNVAVGDVERLMIRPTGTFKFKLSGDSPDLDLRPYRSLEYKHRNTTNTSSPTSKFAKTTSGSTVKQLAVIGLDNDNQEIARTYYVVSGSSVTGNSTEALTQIINYSGVLGTYEEKPIEGGYDYNFTNHYWLYINEANEKDFFGKNVKLVKYYDSTGNLPEITKLKFEIKEDGVLLDEGVEKLSTNESFYIKPASGELASIKNMSEFVGVVSGNTEFDLYYGAPSNDGTLNTGDAIVPSKTFVVYDPSLGDHVVLFDPTWKQADIWVYDASGRLVISKKNIKTSSPFNLALSKSSIKGFYVVKIFSDDGRTADAKVISK